MTLRKLTPMLWTADLQATMTFYTETLGFVCREYNEDWGWCAMQLDEVEIMFARPNEHTPFDGPKCTGTFYFYYEGDIDTLWASLREKTKVCYALDNFEHGMREFCIYDNNGYMLQFGRDIK